MNQDFSWMFFFLVLFVSYVLGLLWQALLHKVWGTKLTKEATTARAWCFKSNSGEFRIDKVHKKFNYKLKEYDQWVSIDFKDIARAKVVHSSDTASLIEFFLGDWSIWDLAGKYRDVVNSYSINLQLINRQEIPLMVIKQYEQREWWLGALFLSITIGILKRLNMYREAEQVANEMLLDISKKMKAFDLKFSD